MASLHAYSMKIITDDFCVLALHSAPSVITLNIFNTNVFTYFLILFVM